MTMILVCREERVEGPGHVYVLRTCPDSDESAMQKVLGPEHYWVTDTVMASMTDLTKDYVTRAAFVAAERMRDIGFQTEVRSLCPEDTAHLKGPAIMSGVPMAFTP